MSQLLPKALAKVNAAFPEGLPALPHVTNNAEDVCIPRPPEGESKLGKD